MIGSSPSLSRVLLVGVSGAEGAIVGVAPSWHSPLREGHLSLASAIIHHHHKHFGQRAPSCHLPTNFASCTWASPDKLQTSVQQVWSTLSTSVAKFRATFFFSTSCASWHTPTTKIPRRENPPESASLKRQQARVKQKKKEKRKKAVAELRQNFPPVLSGLGDLVNQQLDDDIGTLPGKRKVIVEEDVAAAEEETAAEESPSQADGQADTAAPQQPEPVAETEEEIQLAASADEEEEAPTSPAREDRSRPASPQRLCSVVVVVPESSARGHKTSRRHKDNRAGHSKRHGTGHHKRSETGRQRDHHHRAGHRDRRAHPC